MRRPQAEQVLCNGLLNKSQLKAGKSQTQAVSPKHANKSKGVEAKSKKHKQTAGKQRKHCECWHEGTRGNTHKGGRKYRCCNTRREGGTMRHR